MTLHEQPCHIWYVPLVSCCEWMPWGCRICLLCFSQSQPSKALTTLSAVPIGAMFASQYRSEEVELDRTKARFLSGGTNTMCLTLILRSDWPKLPKFTAPQPLPAAAGKRSNSMENSNASAQKRPLCNRRRSLAVIPAISCHFNGWSRTKSLLKLNVIGGLLYRNR